MRVQKTVAFFWIIFFVWTSFCVYAVATHHIKLISSSGKITKIEVEVYLDVFGNIVVEEIDWGFIDPGETLNRTFYIQNKGNYPHVILTMNVTDWVPEIAESYLNMTWTMENIVIDKDSIYPFTLSLSCAPDVQNFTDYSNDIWITGTKHAGP